MITFGYIVGGEERHYNNLKKSIKSIKDRIKVPYEILIIDNDGKLEDENGIKIIHLDQPRKLQYYWSNRYRLNEFARTEYVMYIDTDAVIANDRIEELIENSEDKFYVCQHWWVKEFGAYLNTNPTDRTVTDKLKGLINHNDPYFASGVFLFNKDKNSKVFEEYWKIFNLCYEEGSDYRTGITDEFILAHALNITKDYKFCHGSLNHCCEKQLMPIEFKDGNIWVSNPYELEREKIVCLHCDTHRRDPSNGYDVHMANYIKNMFYL